MSNQEIINELRQIRMQIAFTPDGEERDKLTKLADKIHTNLAKSTFEEKTTSRKRGR